MTEANAKNRWWVVLGAVLVQLSLGALYSWSVFTTPLVQAGWTKTETQIVFSVGLVSFALVMLAAGKKLAIWGPRKLSILSGLVLGGGWVLAGLLGAYNFWILCLCLGVIGGTGIGLGYVVPIAVGMRWFPDKKGMITGLSVAGFGFGAMGWVKLAGTWGHLLELIGLSGTFITYGLMFTALICLGSKWMVFPPEGWTPAGPPIKISKRPLWQRFKETISRKSAEPPKTEGYTGAAILKTRQYYLIITTFIATAGTGTMTICLMKLYPTLALTNAGMDPVEAAATAGTAMA
ncbi:MAG: MFS transporter, partial [Proteobacteria bacterium]|nr:MFS transporter [Pseudomonadota bacterium]